MHKLGTKDDNNIGKRDDMICRCCDSGEEETQEHPEVCAGTENERRGLEDWDKWQTRVTFWKRMTKKFEKRKLEKLKRRKREEQARKRNGCEAETQGEAADRQEA